MNLNDAVEIFKKSKHEIPIDTIEIEMYGEKVSWEVRMLTSVQLGIIHNAVEKARKLGSILDVVSKSANYDGNWDETIEKLRAELGISSRTEPETIRQYATFEQGSVVCDKNWSRADTVKFAKFFPANFAAIYLKINEMFGRGPDVKKKHVISGKDRT